MPRHEEFGNHAGIKLALAVHHRCLKYWRAQTPRSCTQHPAPSHSTVSLMQAETHNFPNMVQVGGDEVGNEVVDVLVLLRAHARAGDRQGRGQAQALLYAAALDSLHHVHIQDGWPEQLQAVGLMMRDCAGHQALGAKHWVPSTVCRVLVVKDCTGQPQSEVGSPEAD